MNPDDYDDAVPDKMMNLHARFAGILADHVEPAFNRPMLLALLATDRANDECSVLVTNAKGQADSETMLRVMSARLEVKDRLSDLRARLAAKDKEIADLTRRLAACVELPEIRTGSFTDLANKLMALRRRLDEEGYAGPLAFLEDAADALTALRQKMEQA